MGWALSFFILILSALGGMGGYVYVQDLQNQLESQKNIVAAQELAVQEQNNTIARLQDNLELQTNALRVQTQRSQEIQNEMNRYLDIFRRHNLSRLAAARPGLIEPRINNGTKEVFDALEADSAALDRLDD
jgi:hypothetical protein